MVGAALAGPRSPSAARNGAAAPANVDRRLVRAPLADGATRPAAATSTALRVACSLVLGLLASLAPTASAQRSQQQAESAGPARVSPENGAGAGQNDPQTPSSDLRPSTAGASGGPSEGGGGGGEGTTEGNSASGGMATTSSPPTPGPNSETTTSADDGDSSGEQPLPSPTSAGGGRGGSGSNPGGGGGGGGSGGNRSSRDDAGGGKTGGNSSPAQPLGVPSPVLSTPPPETVVLTSVVTDARGQDATTVVRRVFQPAPTLVTPSPTPVSGTPTPLSAAASSHSSTTYVVFGVVGGAAVVAAIIGIWVFRKWKLKPSSRFDQKYDVPSQGTPESAAAFLRELKEP